MIKREKKRKVALTSTWQKCLKRNERIKQFNPSTLCVAGARAHACEFVCVHYAVCSGRIWMFYPCILLPRSDYFKAIAIK